MDGVAPSIADKGTRERFLTGTAQTVYHFPVMTKLRAAAAQPVTFLILLAVFGAIFAFGQDRAIPNPQLASKEINSRVESLLKQMTLEEKIGQTVQYAAGFATGPRPRNSPTTNWLPRGRLGRC